MGLGVAWFGLRMGYRISNERGTRFLSPLHFLEVYRGRSFFFSLGVLHSKGVWGNSGLEHPPFGV
jgi:hypothetical protein